MKRMIFIGSKTSGKFDKDPPKNSEVYASWIKIPFIGCPHGGWLVKGYEYDLQNIEQWFYKEELAEPQSVSKKLIEEIKDNTEWVEVEELEKVFDLNAEF